MSESDSLGNVYMSAEYTNNSEYPITSMSITVNLKDSNENTYLTTFDTVMPGETSPRFEARGPKTGKEEDFEALKMEITAQKTNEIQTQIEYDLKLNKYKWIDIEE